MKVEGIMSGINTYYENDINRVDKANKRPAPEQAEKTEKIEKTEKAPEKVESEVYGNVLSKSADGDVTTAKKQSLNALSDGMVLPKDNTPEVSTTLKETAQKEEEEIDSLTGYTANELDNLYAKGKISKYDYDQEMARRAELTQEEKREEMNEPEEEKESQASIIKQQIEGNNAFSKGMAQLNETASTDNMKAEALNTARENGRLDIMNQIFGQN